VQRQNANKHPFHVFYNAESGGLAHVFKTKGFPSSPGSVQFGVTTARCGRKARGYAFSSKKVSPTIAQTANE